MTWDSNGLEKTEQEFTSLFSAFIDDEVPAKANLDERTRSLVTLAALLGCGGVDEFALYVADVDPVAAREVTYQAVAYLGIGRVRPFLALLADALPPATSQSTVTADTRREAGTAKQVQYFGPAMEGFWKVRDINYLLAANCFGDYYTRGGLSDKERELITFFFLAAQGGVDGAMIAHARANFSLGNDKDFLYRCVLIMVPLVGYPRSLAALTGIDEA